MLKSFSEKFVKEFSFRFNGIVTMLSSKFVTHDKFQSTVEKLLVETYDYIFAIAEMSKIKPKQLAKFLGENKQGTYVKEVIEELAKSKEAACAKGTCPTTEKVAKTKKK